jgi:hypothetical protein
VLNEGALAMAAINEVRGGMRRDLRRSEWAGKARRLQSRRLGKGALRRPRLVRSEVRRGPGEVLGALLPLPLSGAAYEGLMTRYLQSAIVAAMIGMSLFFRGPIAAVLGSWLK